MWTPNLSYCESTAFLEGTCREFTALSNVGWRERRISIFLTWIKCVSVYYWNTKTTIFILYFNFNRENIHKLNIFQMAIQKPISFV